MSYVGIIITFVFINNFILTQFLGLCPFIGVSKNVDSAVGMGFAVTFVMSLASLTTWAIHHWLLVPLGLTYLHFHALGEVGRVDRVADRAERSSSSAAERVYAAHLARGDSGHLGDHAVRDRGRATGGVICRCVRRDSRRAIHAR